MKIFKVSSRLMSMSDDVWRRHMNPWSVYTRMLTLPLFALAIWSRVWLNWFALIPVGLVIIWTWLNPRIFPEPKSTDNWASKVVLGERLLISHSAQELKLSSQHIAVNRVTNLLSSIGAMVMLIGLYQLNLWMTLCGMLTSMIAKLWFVDRMVWLWETRGDELTDQ